MAYEEVNYQKFNTDNFFSGMIDRDGNIYNANARSNQVKIGIDAQREQELLDQIGEMQETLDNYREKLIELGVIQVSKTPEQIAQEQAEQQAIINQQLLEAIGALNTEIKELKGVSENGMDRKSTGTSGEAVGIDSKKDGTRPGTSRKSDKPREKTPAANNE